MIQIANLSKEFAGDAGPVRILDRINLNVPAGSLFTLLGPSGCGKTTTLRSVAGLEQPTAGEIRLNQHLVFSSDAGVRVPPEKRNVGMVFQSYAIWPHMTVLQNVMYPLDAQRIAIGEKQRRAMEVLERVGLAEFAHRPATRLSGGQQQRVALARALVARPQVLLFDEPLSNLDAKLREQLRLEIVTLQKEFGITSLYVTHDQEEALAISDQIAIMKDGRILEVGDAYTLYTVPGSRFSASFLGLANFVDGRIVMATSDTVQVETPLGLFVCRNPHGLKVGSSCHVFFRPESVRLESLGMAGHVNRIRMSISNQLFLGHAIDVRFTASGHTIRAKIVPQHMHSMGPEADILVDANACIVLPLETAAVSQEESLLPA